VPVPTGCPGPNNDTLYGGCTTQCKFGPFCGDGITQSPPSAGPEECDIGKKNGSDLSKDGCTFGCTKPHYCGDKIIDTDLGEECDLGDLNGQALDASGTPSTAAGSKIVCDTHCHFNVTFF